MEKARLGAYDRTKQNPQEQEFRAAKIVLHKNYKHRLAPDNDLAIIELERKVQLTDSIYPICVPKYGDYFQKDDTAAEIAGKIW